MVLRETSINFNGRVEHPFQEESKCLTCAAQCVRISCVLPTCKPGQYKYNRKVKLQWNKRKERERERERREKEGEKRERERRREGEEREIEGYLCSHQLIYVSVCCLSHYHHHIQVPTQKLILHCKLLFHANTVISIIINIFKRIK